MLKKTRFRNMYGNKLFFVDLASCNLVSRPDFPRLNILYPEHCLNASLVPAISKPRQAVLWIRIVFNAGPEIKKASLKDWKSDFFVNFGPFPSSWIRIRIRIPTTELKLREPNQCRSTTQLKSQ
jgi:hypothetical protein